MLLSSLSTQCIFLLPLLLRISSHLIRMVMVRDTRCDRHFGSVVVDKNERNLPFAIRHSKGIHFICITCVIDDSVGTRTYFNFNKYLCAQSMHSNDDKSVLWSTNGILNVRVDVFLSKPKRLPIFTICHWPFAGCITSGERSAHSTGPG